MIDDRFYVYVNYLKFGILLGVLISVLVMIIIFLYLFFFMRVIMFLIEFIVEEFNVWIWLDFDFLGDVFLDRDGEGGFGVIESFLNDEINLLLDLFVVKVLVFCLMGCLRGLIVCSDLLFEDFWIGDFLGDILGWFWVFVDCMRIENE